MEGSKDGSPLTPSQAAYLVVDPKQSSHSTQAHSLPSMVDGQQQATPVKSPPSRLLQFIAARTSPAALPVRSLGESTTLARSPSVNSNPEQSQAAIKPQSPTSIPINNIVAADSGDDKEVQIRCREASSVMVNPPVVVKQGGGDEEEDKFYSVQSSLEAVLANEPVGDARLMSQLTLRSSSGLVIIPGEGGSIVATPSAAKGSTSATQGKEMEILQHELAETSRKYDVAMRTNGQLRAVLADYERTMAQIIEARGSASSSLADNPERLRGDNQRLMADLQTAQIAFQNLLHRYDELKRMHEELRATEHAHRQRISELQAELANADRRYESLRRQAELKLDDASRQLDAAREGIEGELAVMRARLHKADLRITSLESTIEAKTRENGELMTICDELIGKIDAAKSTGGS